MITTVLYGRRAYVKPGSNERCVWGLVWEVAPGDGMMVRCCEKKAGHKGPHKATFEDTTSGYRQYVRIEWASPEDRVDTYFKKADEESGCEGAD